MSEEIKNTELENQEEQDAIDIITEMRANTVSKDKYNNLKEDNEKLMRALANGETLTVEPPKTANIEDLRKEYFEFESKNDMEIAQDILALREAIIESGERDPFLPNGKGVQITPEDVRDAQAVADLLQYALDNSQGKNDLFIAQFASQLIDSPVQSSGMTGNGRRKR